MKRIILVVSLNLMAFLGWTTLSTKAGWINDARDSGRDQYVRIPGGPTDGEVRKAFEQDGITLHYFGKHDIYLNSTDFKDCQAWQAIESTVNGANGDQVPVALYPFEAAHEVLVFVRGRYGWDHYRSSEAELYLILAGNVAGFMNRIMNN